MPDEVVVHLDAPDLAPMREVGRLRHVRAGSPAIVAFSYSETWLAANDAFPIDPALGLFGGDQYAPDGAMAGIFTDAAPDRWGRTLLQRRETVAARRERRQPRRLDDWDYLVGVNDGMRIGALRLADPQTGQFLDASRASVPPRARLRDLEYWAQEFERRPPQANLEEEQALALLLAPGSSLGGARPKANFIAEDGVLWIAKFPSRDDDHDVGAWEYLLTRVAADAGITVAQIDLLRLGPRHRTFASRRFERNGAARSLYASAMTLAGKRDGADASYLDVAEAIEQHGEPSSIDAQLEELFRRVILNVLAANRDDHLRNHGFLRTSRGWRLAPAFDLNPASLNPEHTLALDESNRTPDLSLAVETAPLYRLTGARAQRIVDEVRAALDTWKRIAVGIELPDDEVDTLTAAFAAAAAGVG
ncbi:MAG: HipA domain-containing protein [Chloroflexota bacterium]|nr:HipA domain-containing protein [Chloroflexota bacterium]